MKAMNMAQMKEPIKIIFYKSDTGVEPVREWLKKQSKKDKKNTWGRYHDGAVLLAVGHASCTVIGKRAA